MEEYIIMKAVGDSFRTYAVKKAAKGRQKSFIVSGNLPELYGGMTIFLELEETYVTDYILKPTDRNISILVKHNTDIKKYGEAIDRHQMLKEQGVSWSVANLEMPQIYDMLSFSDADKVHKEMINNAQAPERISAINKRIIEGARRRKKIDYSVEEYLSYFDETEQEGAYQRLLTFMKIDALQSNSYNFVGGKIIDSEMKQKEDFIKSDIAERIDNEYSLLTKNEIQKYLDRINDNGLAEEQKAVMWCLEKSCPCIVTGGAGCVDCDTEFFNGCKWKKISEFECGDKVLQYNEDGTASLVYPINYIKKKCESMWHFKTSRGLDQCLTDEHNVVYRSDKTNALHRMSFKDVRERQKNSGFRGKFITSFEYSGRGIDLSEAEIRLMVAVFADGTFKYTDCSDYLYRKCRFHIKKDHKKARLEMLFAAAGLEYEKRESTAEGYDDYYVIVPFRCKHFPSDWYNCNNEQLRIIADELVNWDCSYNKKNCYSTTSESDADFIQFVMSSIGRRSTICTQDRVEQEHIVNGKVYKRKSKEFYVNWTDTTLISMCYDKREDHQKTQITPYKTKDGYKYCFTVISNMLILRRNGKIFVTGNCGKTTVIKNIIECYGSYYSKRNVLLVAPTGKASRRLAEKTGMPASTIHKALRKNPEDDFVYYTAENPLPHRLIIIDESSMIDTELMYDLLSAINKTSKVIFAGDCNQLEPVGYGEPFFDFMNTLEVFRLTKNHRQSDDTDILLMAENVLNGRKIHSGRSVIVRHIDFDEIGDILVADDDVQILSPYNELNVEINYFLRKGEDDLNINDKVIMLKNTKNYCNGDIGFITAIDRKSITIDIEGRKVKVTPAKRNHISLAYSITIHKMQGSESDRVILFIPDDYTISRRMMYTAVTRAKKELEIYYYKRKEVNYVGFS